MNNKIGVMYANTFVKIAEYYERELLDYRKADKIYRIGNEELQTQL